MLILYILIENRPLAHDCLTFNCYFYTSYNDIKVRKTAIIFFLASALLFIVGHSVFPHSHNKEASCAHCITEKKNLSLTDVIRNTLSQDLGANHLEEYNHSSALKFPRGSAGGSFLMPAGCGMLAAGLVSNSPHQAASDISIPQYFHFPKALRAPPVRL
jgi:hypothetical protein